jgi:hypothetical protein
MESMTLDFPDPNKRIRVLTDSSDLFYAVLVTQKQEEQLDLPMEEQDHQPLEFFSGEFKGVPKNGQHQRGKVSLSSTQ